MATARTALPRDEEPKLGVRKEKPIVSPTNVTRVTVAFPFATVKIAQPSDAAVELAGIVAALARALAAGTPDPSELTALAVRADEIAAG
ncbi:MAG: hypothetical protein ACXVQY_11565 [Actinomycetota bacterium]